MLIKERSKRSFLASSVILLLFSLTTTAQKAEKDYARSVADISQQIESVAATLNEQKSLLKTAQDQLLLTEKRELAVRNQIASTEQKANALNDQIDVLTEEILQANKRMISSKDALRSLIQNRYKSGMDNYAKLVLNQENPYAVGRLNNYNDYFAQAMKERINSIAKQADNTRQLQQRLAESELAIREERDKLKQQQRALGRNKNDRAKFIKQLDQEVATSSVNLERLKADRDRLNELIQQIAKKAAKLQQAEEQRRQAAQQTEQKTTKQATKKRLPVRGGFTKQKGRLAYPSTGQQKRKYGSRVASTGMTSDGIFFSTQKGAVVTAIFRGRVLFADYLKGYGLLLIIDHGDEHISLYGHNEVLYKSVGDSVNTGEIVSRSGMTGGLKSPGLYFEIRKNASPINPALWCRK